MVVPGGWLTPSDARGKAFEGVARVVYGYKGGSSSPDPAFMEWQARQGTGSFRWITALKERMIEAGFSVSAHVASNERGACLVVVAHIGQ